MPCSGKEHARADSAVTMLFGHSYTFWTNICSAEKDTKYSSVLLLRLVSFSVEQMLCLLWYLPQ